THIHLMVLPALSAEPKEDPRANDLDVPRAKRGQPERSVLARVLAVANTHERLIQDAHGRREHSFAWDAWSRQISVDAFADPWERFREVNQSAVLRLVAHLSPSLVMSLLTTSALSSPLTNRDRTCCRRAHSPDRSACSRAAAHDLYVLTSLLLRDKTLPRSSGEGPMSTIVHYECRNLDHLRAGS